MCFSSFLVCIFVERRNVGQCRFAGPVVAGYLRQRRSSIFNALYGRYSQRRRQVLLKKHHELLFIFFRLFTFCATISGPACLGPTTPETLFFFYSCLFLLPRPCSHHPPLLQTYRSSHDQSRRVGLFSFLLFLLLTFIISSSVSTLLRARFLALHLFRSKRQKPSARAYFCGRWWQSCFFPCCLGFP